MLEEVAFFCVTMTQMCIGVLRLSRCLMIPVGLSKSVCIQEVLSLSRRNGGRISGLLHWTLLRLLFGKIVNYSQRQRHNKIKFVIIPSIGVVDNSTLGGLLLDMC